LARAADRFVCQSCGAVYPRWIGRCDACGEWNSIVEEAAPEAVPKGLGSGKGRRVTLTGLDSPATPPPRRPTGIAELDRVTGGGLVPGSALLVAGDPGIGKSTLLLQAAAVMARNGAAVAYVSGEESPDQVQMRAKRLGLADAPVQLGAATAVRDILATFDEGTAPDLLVVDSIQTMYLDSLDSAPGTVTQVRAAAHELIRFAKRRGTVLVLVGHVTKEGQVAGPRLLEHMVDAVLYFEGERVHQFRVLRSVKNRFGPSNEIGVFEMTDGGLAEVANPSALFLSQRSGGISGSAVFAGIEGSRPVLVEIQALVAPSPLATPRRAVVGWDAGRLAMILAVLDTRCGLALTGKDIYLNVAGGLRIAEPAADLAVAAALVSSLHDRPVPEMAVVFGEVGLSGEVRPVSHSDARLREAAKLGFERAFVPATRGRRHDGIALSEVVRLADLVDMLVDASDVRHGVKETDSR